MGSSKSLSRMTTLSECRKCLLSGNGALATLVGHDHQGHRISSSLMRAGITTPTLLAEATDDDLYGVRDLGAAAVERIRAAIPTPQPRPDHDLDRRGALQERLPVRLDRQMLTDSGCAAALWILTAISRADPRIWRHVTNDHIAFAAILAQPGWTPAEKAQLRAAHSLAGDASRATVDLGVLAAQLDELRWSAFLEALQIRRAGLRGA